MAALDQLESNLDEVFHRKAPYQLPENSRKAVARALWWIALLFGLLQLWAAWSLWHLGHVTNELVDVANSLSRAYGTGYVTNHLGFFYYVALGVVIVDMALLLLAVPGLRAMKKTGWSLLYYSLLLNVAYGLVRAFADVGGGIGPLVSALIGSAIGAYFLFQIRDYFLSRPTSHTSTHSKTSPAVPPHKTT